MELSDNDIALIEQYLNGELKGEDFGAFEERMHNNPEFAEAVELQRDTAQALHEFGKHEMKANLKAIQQSIPVSDFAPYEPSIKDGGQSNGGKSSFFKSWAFWIGLLAVTPLITVTIYHFTVTVNQKGEIREVDTAAPEDCFEVMVKTTAGPSVKEEAGIAVPYYGELPNESGDVGNLHEIDSLITAPVDTAFVQVDTTGMDDTITVATEAPAPVAEKAANVIRVCVINSDSSYRFHYQFEGEKLKLYGPFNQSNVNVLQVLGQEESGTYILDYNDVFYDINLKQQTMIPLCKIEFEKVKGANAAVLLDEPEYLAQGSNDTDPANNEPKPSHENELNKSDVQKSCDTMMIEGWLTTGTGNQEFNPDGSLKSKTSHNNVVTKQVVDVKVPIELSSSTNDIIVSENRAYEVVDIMPTFNGGDSEKYQWINSRLKYPKKAIEMGIEGKVYTQFIVRKDGSITDVETIIGIGGGCDEEAIRLIKSMPKWRPGKLKGKTVDVKMILPLVFTLRG